MKHREPERMTAAQKAALEAELAELEGPKRQAIVEAIAHARGFGDLSENFEYHAAKTEGGMLEGRILKLRERLRDVLIIDTTGAGDTVDVGAKVVIEDEDAEQMTVEISGLGGAGTVSPTSPLGKALLGRKVGDVVEVVAPKRTWTAKVVSIQHG